MTSSSSRARFFVGLFFGVTLLACDKDSGGGGDAGADAGPCGVDCGPNSFCDVSGAGPICGCDPGFQDDGSACVANVCPETCGANSFCETNGVCTCSAGFDGDPIAGCTAATAADACHPHNPCLNGGTCTVNGGGYTCACSGNATGTNCETAGSPSCGTYTDVVYAMTAHFEIADTPLRAGDQAFDITVNPTTPPFVSGTNTTPFARPPAVGNAFTRGFARLRYTNDANGTPVAGTVRLVEWYVPLEFTQTKGATVVANTDHSVGIIDSSLAACGSGGTACTNHTPALARACTPNAQGVLVGRTLTWDSCAPIGTGEKTWNYAMAAATTGPGCATGYNGYGNTASTSPLVPASGLGDSYQTWTQPLGTLVFTGTDPLTATFRMPRVQIPNNTGMSTTWLSITSSTVVGTTDCGSTAIGGSPDLVCDQQ